MHYVIGFHVYFGSIEDLTTYGKGLVNGIYKLLHPENEKANVIIYRPDASDDKDYEICEEFYGLAHPSHKESILVIEGDDVMDNWGEINDCIDAYAHDLVHNTDRNTGKLECPFEKRLLIFDDVKEEVREIRNEVSDLLNSLEADYYLKDSLKKL